MAASQEIDKYTHLLQPIRDLAANWNINIANELGEYLEVLEGITFSFQKGQQLNFAEAALVIQGSACVYSKKVEYLHSLVYQALEFVADRKVKSLKSKGKADAGLQDDDEFDDEEHFLSLDDTLEEGIGIDLEEDAQLEEALPVRLPATLLALEDTGLGDGDGEAGNYRIASCAVHHSGALLLEARDGFMLDEFLRPITNGVAQPPPAFGGQGLPLAAVAAPAAGMKEAQQPPQHDDFDGGGAMDDYFDGTGGDDFPMDDAAPPPPSMPNEESPAATLARAAPAGDGQEIEEEEEEFDPYAPLDPSDTGAMPSKPFKRYSRLPNKPKMRAAQQLPPAHALIDGLLLLPAPATGLLFPEFNYALHQSQLENAREARKLSREVAAAKQNKKLNNKSGATAVFTMKEAEDAMAAASEDDDTMHDGDNGFDPGFFDDQIDAGMPDDDDFEGAFADAAGGGGWGFDGPLQDLLNENGTGDGEISYEDLCRAHVESLISAAAAAEVQTELASRVSTWRMKMAPVLEEEDARPEFDIHYYGERILQGLAKLSVADTTGNTQLNEVDDEEGNENPSSKNKKSTRGGGRGKQNKDSNNAIALTGPVEFKQVVTGAEVENDYDVPRLFSSMLQLVNNGNLRVAKIKDSSDNFKISLLSTELKHKRIEAYLAPSSAAAEAALEEGMGEVEDATAGMVAAATTTAEKKPTSKRRKA